MATYRSISFNSNEQIKKSIKDHWKWNDAQIDQLSASDLSFIQLCFEQGNMDDAKLLFYIGQNVVQTQAADITSDIYEYR